MKKIISFFLICMISLLLLTACHQSPERIKVDSSDYASLKYLEEGVFDKEQLLNWYNPEYSYDGYTCYVSILDGNLCISNSNVRQQSFLQQFDNGYFFGVDLGEFDGWVRYHPYFSQYPESGYGALVSTENCLGIVAQDRRNGYIITYKALSSSGTVYKIYYSEENKKWEWTLLKSFETTPMAFSYQKDQDILYIATSGTIVSISNDNHVSTIVESEILNYIDINSIVYNNDSLWCGSSLGVYRYCIEEREEKWYPMDYQAHINK